MKVGEVAAKLVGNITNDHSQVKYSHLIDWGIEQISENNLEICQ